MDWVRIEQKKKKTRYLFSPIHDPINSSTAGGIVGGYTNISPWKLPYFWSLSFSWNESRWSTIASVLISTSYVLGRHGVRAASRIGPFLASFGILSPSLLGNNAPISIGPFHMTFPPRDLTFLIESMVDLDETSERALEMYRTNWSFAKERPSIETRIGDLGVFLSTFVFSVATRSEVDGTPVITREQIENIEVVEGDEQFGKILAMACFNVMDLNGDGMVSLDEALVGALILMDSVIDQPEGNEAQLLRLQDLSFRILDAKSTFVFSTLKKIHTNFNTRKTTTGTNAINFSDWRYWCAKMFEVNDREENEFHFNVSMEGKSLTFEEVKKTGKLDAVLDMLTRDILMAEYDLNHDGQITREEFNDMTNSKWKHRFIFAKWIYDCAQACNGGKYRVRINSTKDGSINRKITLTIQL